MLSGNGRSGCWRCSDSKIQPTSENQARKSSTSEKEVLLQEVADLVRSFPPAKKTKQSQNAAKATATMRRDGAVETWAAAEDITDTPEEILQAMYASASPAVEVACTEAEEAAPVVEPISPLPCTGPVRAVCQGRHRTLDSAVDVLTSRTSRHQQQLVLDERKVKMEEEKLKLEEEKFKLERDRYKNIELARMQLLIEDHRDRALERQQRSDEHSMMMKLLKTVLEKLNR
ncbi:unnamed protein product [Ixodes persulcatus]